MDSANPFDPKGWAVRKEAGYQRSVHAVATPLLEVIRKLIAHDQLADNHDFWTVKITTPTKTIIVSVEIELRQNDEVVL